jgi:predicted NAD/FAD-binding protein
VQRRDAGSRAACCGHARGGEVFDQVVLACHSDQALAILGDERQRRPSAGAGAIRYQPNRAVLHTDAALLPRGARCGRPGTTLPARRHRAQPVGVSYLINRLQPLPVRNAGGRDAQPAREPDPAKVIAEFDYAHPIFDGPAIAAQRASALCRDARVWFCGAWGGYGFHEDGLRSAPGAWPAPRLPRAPWRGRAGRQRRLTA